jgi:anti-sigma B factor antagonist
MEAPPSLEVAALGPATYLLSGELDLWSAPSIAEGLEPATQVGGPVTIDLSGVSFIDMAGVHALVGLLDRLPSGCLILHGAQPAVDRVFSLTGLPDLPGMHVAPCRPNPDADVPTPRAAGHPDVAHLRRLVARSQRNGLRSASICRHSQELCAVTRAARSERLTHRRAA